MIKPLLTIIILTALIYPFLLVKADKVRYDLCQKEYLTKVSEEFAETPTILNWSIWEECGGIINN